MHNVTCRQVGSSFGGMDYCDLLRRFNGFNRSEQAAEVRELRSVECPYDMQLRSGQRGTKCYERPPAVVMNSMESASMRSVVSVKPYDDASESFCSAEHEHLGQNITWSGEVLRYYVLIFGICKITFLSNSATWP